jgi:hypothetical protein
MYLAGSSKTVPVIVLCSITSASDPIQYKLCCLLFICIVMQIKLKFRNRFSRSDIDCSEVSLFFENLDEVQGKFQN